MSKGPVPCRSTCYVYPFVSVSSIAVFIILCPLCMLKIFTWPYLYKQLDHSVKFINSISVESGANSEKMESTRRNNNQLSFIRLWTWSLKQTTTKSSNNSFSLSMIFTWFANHFSLIESFTMECKNISKPPVYLRWTNHSHAKKWKKLGQGYHGKLPGTIIGISCYIWNSFLSFRDWVLLFCCSFCFER